MPEPQTAEQYAASQQAEWGKYVATERIVINGVLAFLPGHPVPASHVERGVVDKSQVVGANTKAAESAQSKES